MNTTAARIDWSQLWYPGPRRAFTADEMARAGHDGPSATLVAMVAINFAALALAILMLAPAAHTARLTAGLAALAVLSATAARWLWWRPWRRPLLQAQIALAAAMVLLAMAFRWRLPLRPDRELVALVLGGGGAVVSAALWFLVAWRSQQIEGRLREQAERGKAIEMARRLATAQVEPHFLFNTLASLQHWVQTKDDRAAPLLAALTGYLRATLPLFDRPLLPARDELVALRRYLEVIQARLGPRLAFDIDVDPAAEAALLPPGLLLTLVENAVVHGIEPQVAGGRIRVRGSRAADSVHFVVQDDGAGLPVVLKEGLGLSSIRQRLVLMGDASARLDLQPAAGGGCIATLSLAWREEATA